METKRFELRVLLTCTTGRLITKGKEGDNGIGGLYELLGWMTNDSPFTHQLGRFSEECRPWLLEWFPELVKIGGTELQLLQDTISLQGPKKGVDSWLKHVKTFQGLRDKYDVPRIPPKAHAIKDPVEEFVEMMQGKKIIALETPDA